MRAAIKFAYFRYDPTNSGRGLGLIRGCRMAIGASLLLILPSCQNGDYFARAGSKAIPPVTTAAEEGIWLGHKAVPIAAPADIETSRQSENVQATTWQATTWQAPTWQVRAGESVSGVVRRWAESAGYTPLPVFSASESWSVIVTQEFTGSFEDALIWLSDGFQRQALKPVAVLFANRTLDLVGQSTPIAGRIAVRD